MRTPFIRKLENLKERFFPSEIIQEEFIAFSHSLPDGIKVSWKREGKFIIGKITDDDNIYYAQAKSAKDFVEMVNDVIYSVYGIKLQYYKSLGENRYFPNDSEEFERLNNKAIKKSEISLAKRPQTQNI